MESEPDEGYTDYDDEGEYDTFDDVPSTPVILGPRLFEPDLPVEDPTFQERVAVPNGHRVENGRHFKTDRKTKHRKGVRQRAQKRTPLPQPKPPRNRTPELPPVTTLPPPPHIDIDRDSLLELLADPRKLKRESQRKRIESPPKKTHPPPARRFSVPVQARTSSRRDSYGVRSRDSQRSSGNPFARKSTGSERSASKSSKSSTRKSKSRSRSVSYSSGTSRRSPSASGSAGHSVRSASWSRSPKEERRSSGKERDHHREDHHQEDNRQDERWEQRDRYNREKGEEWKRRIMEEEKKEKRELLYSFYVMEMNGIPLSKKWTMEDDLDEMRFEHHKIKSEHDVNDKVRVGWNIFSAVNSIGELVNNQMDPFNVSIEGWTDELDKEKDRYVPVFRKIYKNMAVRFQMRPALQLAIMFGTQFLVFIVPRLLKKVSFKGKNKDVSEKGRPYPWTNNDPAGAPQRDDRLNELVNLVKGMKSDVEEQKETLRRQQQNIDHFKNSFVNPLRGHEEGDIERQASPPCNVKSEKIYPHPNDNEVLSFDLEPHEKFHGNHNFDEEDLSGLGLDETAEDGRSVRMSQDSMGSSFKQLMPLVKVFKKIQDKPPQIPLDMKMFSDVPEMPDSMKPFTENPDNNQDNAEKRENRKSTRIGNTLVLE